MYLGARVIARGPSLHLVMGDSSLLYKFSFRSLGICGIVRVHGLLEIELAEQEKVSTHFSKCYSNFSTVLEL